MIHFFYRWAREEIARYRRRHAFRAEARKLGVSEATYEKARARRLGAPVR